MDDWRPIMGRRLRRGGMACRVSLEVDARRRVHIRGTAAANAVASRTRDSLAADIKDLFCAKFSMSARSMIVVHDLCEAVAAVFILAERVVNQY